jgi:hypothetical protein
MMRVLVFVVLLAPVLSVAQESPVAPEELYPQQMSAEELLVACNSGSLTNVGRQRRKYCAGFISGVEEALRILRTQHQLEASVCPPKNVTARALADAYRHYAAQHREQLDRPAAEEVLEALAHAFPCPGWP